MANIYNVGDKPKITGMFANNGNAVDPAVVVVKYKDPAGVITALTYGADVALTKDATGIYSFYIPLTQSGRWYYRMEDNGANVATEAYLNVSISRFR